MTQAGGTLYLCNGTGLNTFTDVTGAATTQDPHASEAATTVEDVTSDGTTVYAALGVNGIP